MILQALKEYYDRKIADSESTIAPEGFEKKEFPFLIVIDEKGAFVSLEDTRETIGKKLFGKTYLVPRSLPRSGSKSHETTFLLWDHLGYVLEHQELEEKAKKQHMTWLSSLQSLPRKLKEDKAVAAVLMFYNSDGVKAVKASPGWQECARLNSCNITFRIAGDLAPVPCCSLVQEYVRSGVAGSEEGPDSRQEALAYGRCMVTGEIGEIARIHGRTPISKDSKSLVGFQKNSGYDSYGKEQGYNAPVSKSAEFAYTTALNTLLKAGATRMLVGDAVTVFWSAKESELETTFPQFFGEPPKDDPDRNVRAVESLFRSVQTGTLPMEGEDSSFYVLGLAPNSARISVRFWIVDTVRGISQKICQHFSDTRITHGSRDKDALSLFRLLVSTASQGKADNIQPNLAGNMMRAILEGLPYPQTLLQSAVRRIRAEHEITYPRAALIKACINRSARCGGTNQERELAVGLDESNSNIGYSLGRLFATLEKIQIRAHTSNGGKEPNSTIRDKYYGSASGTPRAVFSTLIRLSKHHLSKIENVGEKVKFEKLIGQIMDGIPPSFPGHLSLDDQGRFAIGYYHQMQHFFTKHNAAKSE